MPSRFSPGCRPVIGDVLTIEPGVLLLKRSRLLLVVTAKIVSGPVDERDVADRDRSPPIVPTSVARPVARLTV